MSIFPPPGVKVLTIGELTRGVKSLLEDTFGVVWVEGEVCNLKKHTSGHIYLSLRDTDVTLAAVLYRAVGLRMRFDLQDGMRVIARGRLSVYPPQGVYQFQIEEVQPKGIGPLELAFRQLKEKLSVKGYFDPRRKKPLPRIPRRVVLISSPTGSSVRDMLETLGRRWPTVDVWVCPVRVQGEGSAQEVSAALDLLNRIGGPRSVAPIDVIIIGRGGGSLEDLWTFNEEMVADAIYRSRIPIVTGIGHEDDLTIADMVADRRALTPTAAATTVVPDGPKVLEWLGELEGRLRSLLRRNLDAARARLDHLVAHRCFRTPLEPIRDHERSIDEWAERLRRAVRLRLEAARRRLEAQAAQLETLSPLNVLGRGYSLTRREEDGAVVRDPDQVRRGERVITHLEGGRIVSRVEEISDERAGIDMPHSPDR
jgi:exodeoxyribonuclease VII large subunit